MVGSSGYIKGGEFLDQEDFCSMKLVLGRSCKLYATKSMEDPPFNMRILKQGNNNSNRLAYTLLVSAILDCGAVCWGPYRGGQVSALNLAQRKAVKFVNHTKESGWEIWYSVE
jgi:hypothetical protein